MIIFRNTEVFEVLKALISGIIGQDGSYLADLLLEKGHEVHGLVRRIATHSRDARLWRISHLLDESSRLHGVLNIHEGSLDNPASVSSLIQKIRPDQVYHLAAQSDVGASYEDPFTKMSVNVLGTQYVLEACRRHCPKAKIYFAGSSEQFGPYADPPMDEKTLMRPISPYAVSKISAYSMCGFYRDCYDMFIARGILFNHESPRRGEEFVTRKITRAVARIVANKQKVLSLGNMEARRDWGHSEDYVRAMWMMLDREYPDDFVISTGKSHSVEDFCVVAFDHVGLNWKDYVKHDAELLRDGDIPDLVGNSSKAASQLGWSPEIHFSRLVKDMVEADVERES